MDFFNEVKKIHYQLSMSSAILMAIRGRVERKAETYSTRIGSAFPNGDQSVLIFGPGGTGKTHCMKRIFNGLKLDSRASFIDSGGMATSIGLLELIHGNSKSILFLDEMDWDNKQHLTLFKQLANGKIYRQKDGGGHEFEFDGLVIASTNSISIPRGNKSEHLYATLDRFILVKSRKSNFKNEEVLENIIRGSNFIEEEPNWNLIAERLNGTWDSPITKNESMLIKKMWDEKSKEEFDSNKENFRNMHRLKDCLLFVKRMEQSKDISKNEELVKIFFELSNDLVMINKGEVAWMDRPKQEVFSYIKKSLVPLSPKEIMDLFENSGSSIDRRTLHRKLRELVDSGFVYRYAFGKYWIKNNFEEKVENCLLKI